MHQGHGVFEILVGLAGIAGDEIRRQRDVGTRGAQLVDNAPVAVVRMAAVHRLKNFVGTGLHGQMQERHQLRHIAVGFDQVVVHVARMRCGVANARQAIDLRQRAN